MFSISCYSLLLAIGKKNINKMYLSFPAFYNNYFLLIANRKELDKFSHREIR
jgi:hypothetical protein